jgi:uncharacterized membrane protein
MTISGTSTSNVGPSNSAHLANKWFRKRHDDLTPSERNILDALHGRTHISRAPESFETRAEAKTFGERMADRVAEFGGSWTFIMLFAAFLVAWALINTVVLVTRAFDPYPFIFLNLLLSMIAAVQAPIIMMSQNRQGKKDRENAEHDYEVNLKAELEIMSLHEKLDQMRAEQITRLLTYQQEQMTILTSLLERGKA